MLQKYRQKTWQPELVPCYQGIDSYTNYTQYTSIPIQSCYLGFLSEFPQNLGVFDIGCGSGYTSYLLSQRRNILTAIDASKDQIQRLQLQIPEIEWIHHTLGDGKPWTSSKQFDLSICLDVLEHVSNRYQFLTELHNILNQTQCDCLLISLVRDLHHGSMPDFGEVCSVFHDWSWTGGRLVYPFWYEIFQMIKSKSRELMGLRESDYYHENFGTQSKLSFKSNLGIIFRSLIPWFHSGNLRLEPVQTMQDPGTYLILLKKTPPST